MVIVTISTVASVFILNLNYRTVKTHGMGEWVSQYSHPSDTTVTRPILQTRNILLNWLPWLLMMKRPNQKLEPPPCIPKYARKRQIPQLDSNQKDDWCHICQKTDGAHHGRGQRLFIISNRLDYEEGGNENDCQTIENRVEACLRQIISKRLCPLNTDIRGGTKPSDAIYDLLAMLQQLYDQLKMMTDKAPEMDEEDDVKNDWEFAGMVIDKLCLMLFTMLIACSTMIILFSAPHVMA